MKALSFMKWTMFLVLGIFMMTSCSDDDEGYEAPDAVKTAFAQKYGNANNVSWNKNGKGKHVASFMASGKKTAAWFESNGTWIMTKIELGRSLSVLPDAVVEAYNYTRYAAEGWTIDEIEEIQKADEAGSIFKIEVEKDGQPDYDLYFSETGVLIEEVMDIDDGDEDEEDFDDDGDDDDDELNPGIPSISKEIVDYIVNAFPGAELLYFDIDDGLFEVGIVANGERILLHFDRNYSWVRTIYDYTQKMPDFVVDILKNNFADKTVESCLYVEEVNKEPYFVIDLDNYDNDIMVTKDGRFTEIAD